MDPHKVETELLVLAAQQGHSNAFTLLFQRHHKSLLQYACKFSGNEEVAKEAVQEAWFETAKNIRKLTDPRAFRSWLYKKVRWRILDEIRKQAPVDVLLNEDVYGDESPPETLSEVISSGLKRLPLLEREMIQLFYLDEMSVSEIGVVLDIPPGTVKSRLNRARNLLKQRMNEEDLV